MTNIAVLVSGGGTNLQALIDAEKAGKIENGGIRLVVSSNPNAFALERAAKAGIETAVLRRGKNASKATVAKHATVQEYRASTGFECLLGWLYLQGRNDRIEELFNAMWDGYKPE